MAQMGQHHREPHAEHLRTADGRRDGESERLKALVEGRERPPVAGESGIDVLWATAIVVRAEVELTPRSVERIAQRVAQLRRNTLPEPAALPDPRVGC
jgi:hypothetical protein